MTLRFSRRSLTRCDVTTEPTTERTRTLLEVSRDSKSLQDFGLNLRDWQHDIQRGGVHSRRELAARLADPPPELTGRIEQGDVADAYLAAYAEWIADRAGIRRPDWCGDPRRCADSAWFSSPERAVLLVRSPASFRQRNLFTIPDPVFSPRRGRPRVPASDKREKARQRQRLYRARIRELVGEAREQRKKLDG